MPVARTDRVLGDHELDDLLAAPLLPLRTSQGTVTGMIHGGELIVTLRLNLSNLPGELRVSPVRIRDTLLGRTTR